MKTIHDANQQYVLWSCEKYKSSTVKQYIHWINKFIDFVGKDKEIKEISINTFIEYAHYLKKINIKKSTQAYYLIGLRQLWEWMYLNKYTDIPHKLIPIPQYQAESFPPAEKDHVDKIIESIKEEGDGFIQMRDELIVSMLYATGVRVSELCDLTIEQLQLAQRYTSIISKKNNLRRTIVWDDTVEVLLLRYLAHRIEHATSNALFISMDAKNKGQKITTRSVQRMMSKHRKKANITIKITPHSMRHAYGKDSTEQKRHPRFIQRALGHKNIVSSQIYLQLNDVELREEAKEFLEKRKEKV